jgi:nondiscriminating aspartyl-tRNA synthetase
VPNPILRRTFAQDLHAAIGKQVLLRGWVHRLRTLATTTFIVVRDVSGEAQCVIASSRLRDVAIKVDDTIEIIGVVRSDARAKLGCEVDIERVAVLNPATHRLPFNSSSDIAAVRSEVLLEYRPLAARNDRVGDVFRVQAALLAGFREFLLGQHFTEIVTTGFDAIAGQHGPSQLCPQQQHPE